MSQTVNPRTQRTAAGMVGALIVVVALVVVVVWFRSSDEKAAPVRTVDWAAWVKAGRAEHQLTLFAPPALPKGWRATSVEYVGGTGAHWHLGMLTDRGKYVGVEESRASTKELVEQYIDQDAVAGPDVTVAGETWQTWTDAGGDYALSQSVRTEGGDQQSWLVVGSAPEGTIRDFVGTLKGAPTGKDG